MDVGVTGSEVVPLRERYDVVVVGGGAAGLSGALVLSRARRSVLVLDAGEPRNAPAGRVHNYLGREGVPPGRLLAGGRAEVAQYGGQVVAATAVAVRRLDGPLHAGGGGFQVELADRRSVQARRLLVATGLVDDLPPVPGVAERWGRDVLHCPYCHGWEARDQAIGILATSPMATHQALMWRQLSANVTVFLHTADDLTDAQNEQLAALDVPVVTGEVTGLEVRDDMLTGVHLASGHTIARQVLVVASRLTARAGALAELGLEPVDLLMGEHVVGSRIPADASGATPVPGVWVAGNLTDPLSQVITSAAAGLTAASAINGDLIAEDAARAVARRQAAPHGAHRASAHLDPHEVFSAQAEREVAERAAGHRRHGRTLSRSG